ncbi:MAG: hypothetical protein FWF31_01720 [Desulfobulbus sp.]|nr:hypothetical protein [Desulfobulbus sp.]
MQHDIAFLQRLPLSALHGHDAPDVRHQAVVSLLDPLYELQPFFGYIQFPQVVPLPQHVKQLAVVRLGFFLKRIELRAHFGQGGEFVAQNVFFDCRAQRIEQPVPCRSLFNQC